MTSGRGRTISWTSFNYPSCISTTSTCSGSAIYSQFSYTPDRQYWKQVSNYPPNGSNPTLATTIYVGGLLEKVTAGTNTDFRHLIQAGSSTIVVSRQSNGVNSVYYLNSDHLGSSVVFNGTSPTVYTSYDAFGRRRSGSWSGGPSASEMSSIAGVTREGYTGQTMLDNLELIHMNGRVQDPMIGRFISADPFITEPMNTQGYNRYSYVYNNPLSNVDPSGFAGESTPRRIPPGHSGEQQNGMPSATCNDNPTNFNDCAPFMNDAVCSSYSCTPYLGEGNVESSAAASQHDPLKFIDLADQISRIGDLANEAIKGAAILNNFSLLKNYPLNANNPHILEQPYFQQILRSVWKNAKVLDATEWVSKRLALAGIALGVIQVANGAKHNDQGQVRNGIANSSAGGMVLFAGVPGAVWGLFEATGLREKLTERSAQVRVKPVEQCGGDMACANAMAYQMFGNQGIGF